MGVIETEAVAGYGLMLVETKTRSGPKAGAATSRRKKVLYVERKHYRNESPNLSRAMSERFAYIRDSLGRRFNVDTQFNLSQGTIYSFQQPPTGESYDAMVTHVPADYGLLDRSNCPEEPYELIKAFYEDGLDILRRIKQIDSGLFIVAYTGALCGIEETDRNVTRLFKKEGPLDELVAKTDGHAEDYRQIEAHLIRRFGMG